MRKIKHIHAYIKCGEQIHVPSALNNAIANRWECEKWVAEKRNEIQPTSSDNWQEWRFFVLRLFLFFYIKMKYNKTTADLFFYFLLFLFLCVCFPRRIHINVALSLYEKEIVKEVKKCLFGVCMQEFYFQRSFIFFLFSWFSYFFSFSMFIVVVTALRVPVVYTRLCCLCALLKFKAKKCLNEVFQLCTHWRYLTFFVMRYNHGCRRCCHFPSHTRKHTLSISTVASCILLKKKCAGKLS